jgi:hypothetical protein
MGIPPDLRTNIDYTFILKNNNANDREKLYKHYAGMFPTREIFEHVLDSCTEDYNCLVIDNTSQSNKLEDQIFFYKAGSHENIRLCSERLWAINREKYINNAMPRAGTSRQEFQTRQGAHKIIIKKKTHRV